MSTTKAGAMERLNQACCRGIAQFLQENYVLRDSAAFVEQTLSSLRRIVPTELIAFCEMVPSKRISLNVLNPAEFPERKECDRRWPAVMHDHPVMQHYLRTGDPTVCKVSDFVTAREFRSRAIFADFYSLLGVQDVMCLNVPAPSPFIVGFAVHRSRRSFTERERLMLNLVQPHLGQAWRNAKKYSQLMSDMRALGQTLDQVNCGVIVLGSAGRVQFMTRRASRYLAEFFGADRGSTNRLPEHLHRWVRHMDLILGRIEIPPPRRPLVVEQDGRRLSIRMVSEGVTRVLLLEEHVDIVPLERLRSAGLTAREAEVLAWVAHGITNARIASILGVSVLTVKKHLQHVFDKLGVDTRTAATVRALRLMR